MVHITAREFAPEDDLDFAGWRATTARERASRRAGAIYDAIGLGADDRKVVIAEMPDGRWIGIANPDVAPMLYAIEAPIGHPATRVAALAQHFGVSAPALVEGATGR